MSNIKDVKINSKEGFFWHVIFPTIWVSTLIIGVGWVVLKLVGSL